jgi:hypothetical protein
VLQNAKDSQGLELRRYEWYGRTNQSDESVARGHQVKSLFTLHAGEIVAGEHIEREYKDLEVWVPAKDTGVDLLITGKKNKKALSLQVKYSTNVSSAQKDVELNDGLRACGWWTLYPQKIKESRADYWIFVLRGFESSHFDFIIIPPAELLNRLNVIHGEKPDRCDTYIWVTKKGRCWETRSLKKVDQSLIAQGKLTDYQPERDFSEYLNNWSPLKELNGL